MRILLIAFLLALGAASHGSSLGSDSYCTHSFSNVFFDEYEPLKRPWGYSYDKSRYPNDYIYSDLKYPSVKKDSTVREQILEQATKYSQFLNEYAALDRGLVDFSNLRRMKGLHCKRKVFDSDGIFSFVIDKYRPSTISRNVQDIEEFCDRPVIVMEPCPGGMLIKDITISTTEVSGIFGKITNAVSQLHDAGFVHGDIRPSMILMCGEYGTYPKLAESYRMFDVGTLREVHSESGSLSGSESSSESEEIEQKDIIDMAEELDRKVWRMDDLRSITEGGLSREEVYAQVWLEDADPRFVLPSLLFTQRKAIDSDLFALGMSFLRYISKSKFEVFSSCAAEMVHAFKFPSIDADPPCMEPLLESHFRDPTSSQFGFKSIYNLVTEEPSVRIPHLSLPSTPNQYKTLKKYGPRRRIASVVSLESFQAISAACSEILLKTLGNSSNRVQDAQELAKEFFRLESLIRDAILNQNESPRELLTLT